MQVIDDTLTALKNRRDEIEAEVTTRRDAFEAEIADKVTELREVTGYIRAIVRQQPGASTSAGPRAPRGQNREKTLAAIATEARTTTEVSDETGIGRGSVSRTLKQLVDDGAARRTGSRYVAVEAS